MNITVMEKLMRENNENQYYDMITEFSFAGQKYKGPINYAYLNTQLDNIFKKYKIMYDETWLVTYHLSFSNYLKMMNNIVKSLFNNRVDKLTVDNIMYDILTMIDRIISLLDSGSKTSLDMSLTALVLDAEKDNKVHDLLYNDHIDDDMLPEEIIDKKEAIIKEMKGLQITGISHLLNSGSGVKADQLFNCFVGLWVRTRIQNMDEIAPRLVKERWLDGLRTRDSLFIETNNNRKAAINTKQVIKDAGVEGKNAAILAQDTYITLDDCGSIHGLKIHIEDKQALRNVMYKYQILDDGSLRVITDKDEHLIGKDIRIRSVLKCASHEGICATCFGYHAIWNKHTDLYRKDLGSEFSKSIVGPAGQAVLSFKHNVTPLFIPINIYVTNLKTGEMSNDYSHLFKRTFKNIIPNKGVKVFINSNDVTNPMLSESDKTSTFEHGVIKYLDAEYDEFDIIRSKNLLMEKDGYQYLITMEAAVTKYHLVAKDIDFKIRGFEKFIKKENELIDITKHEIQYIIPNKSKTEKFFKLKELYASKSPNGKKQGKTLFIDSIEELVIKTKEIIPDVHISGIEVIFRNKIKSKENSRVRPDWTKPEADRDYVILSGSEAINSLSSVTIKLGLGRFNMRLGNPFYYKRSNLLPSTYDILFDTDDEINAKNSYTYNEK